jgi:hypothetical protein
MLRPFSLRLALVDTPGPQHVSTRTLATAFTVHDQVLSVPCAG